MQYSFRIEGNAGGVDSRQPQARRGWSASQKKQAGPPTIDDLLADIDGKLNLIRGLSRSDACRKMTETIASDASLSEGDKKRLTELVSKLEGPN